MKFTLHSSIYTFFSVVLVASCNGGPANKTPNLNQNSPNSPNFNELVENWNQAHLSKDIGMFSNLLDSSILFYGKTLDKNSCLEIKLSLFKKYPDFFQQIYGGIQTEYINDITTKCSFVKRVTVNQETKDYPSYLIFRNIGGQWKIATESDLVTDNNLSKRAAREELPLNSDFITGLYASKVFTKEQAVNGADFTYIDGRKFIIKFYYEQLDVLFFSYNENNQKQRIMTDFKAGYYSPDGEMLELKEKVKFLVGQYDFNADNIDELVIAIQDNDELDNGLSINIFQLTGDTWKAIGVMTGHSILGEPRAEVKMNKITIPRNLRGFYYQWTLESGKFVDTGDY